MDPEKLAKAYEDTIFPLWDEPFTRMLLENFPETLPAKPMLLDLACSTGHLTEKLLGRLAEGGRVVAIDDIRELMEIGRHRVLDFDRKQVFFKKEPPDHLSFADETFDAVLAAGLPPKYEILKVLGEARRLMLPGAFLRLGVAMEGSFQEVFDVFREVLEKEDLTQTQDALDQLIRRMPNKATCTAMLEEAQLEDIGVRTENFNIPFPDALPLLQSPLVREYCLDACIKLIPDRSWREGVLAGMIRALDTYFPDGFELSLNLGVMEATRA